MVGACPCLSTPTGGFSWQLTKESLSLCAIASLLKVSRISENAIDYEMLFHHPFLRLKLVENHLPIISDGNGY